jgi:hypothetical protein
MWVPADINVMKTIMILATILITAMSIFAQAENLVFHEIRDDETLWFLAQVYYGDGNQYHKIADANMVDGKVKFTKGRRLLIPDPVYNPDASDFEKRFVALRRIRSAKLAQKMNRLATNVVLGAKTPKMKEIDSVLKLEKPKDLKTPVQSAEAELKNQ